MITQDVAYGSISPQRRKIRQNYPRGNNAHFEKLDQPKYTKGFAGGNRVLETNTNKVLRLRQRQAKLYERKLRFEQLQQQRAKKYEDKLIAKEIRSRKYLSETRAIEEQRRLQKKRVRNRIANVEKHQLKKQELLRSRMMRWEDSIRKKQLRVQQLARVKEDLAEETKKFREMMILRRQVDRKEIPAGSYLPPDVQRDTYDFNPYINREMANVIEFADTIVDNTRYPVMEHDPLINTVPVDREDLGNSEDQYSSFEF